MLSEESKNMEAVEQNGYNIEHISNPSEAVQLKAVRQDGYNIEHISNPSEAVQLEAVKQNGHAIKYIKNPSEKVQLVAVMEYGSSIQYIQNPSEAVQLEAVKHNGVSIQYITNPFEAVQLEAVKRNGFVIRHIQNPSEQVQLEAVRDNCYAIKYIKNPSEAVQSVSLKDKKKYIVDQIVEITGLDSVDDNDEILEIRDDILSVNCIDFEISDYRFIHREHIDKIQQDELETDTYILGCFNPEFLADVLDLDTDFIISNQEHENFEGLGELVIKMGKIEELQTEYVNIDGYGHHFGRYDGGEYEIDDYFVFRVN